MRLAASLSLAFLLLSGCSDPGTDDAGAASPWDAYDACLAKPAQPYTFHFGPGYSLANGSAPEAGSLPGNAFSSGFLTNDLKEWLSEPVAEGMLLEGTVTLEFWVRSTGTPAPLVLGGDPGEGYHFFNQFGSDRTFQPAYATEYSTVAPEMGAVDHYNETLQMPPGGFVVEKGDRLRLLLTDLAVDSPSGSGHDVLYGGDTPSRVSFEARCFPELTWSPLPGGGEGDVDLPGNQGLLTGAVPPSELNQAEVGFMVHHPVGNLTRRMTVTLEQTGDPNPAKDDIDMEVLDPNGTAVWGIGTPYSDESGTLWEANLNAIGLPQGPGSIRVNSYSGVGYTGHVSVVLQVGVPAGLEPYR